MTLRLPATRGRADRGRQEGEDDVEIVPTDLQQGDADVHAEDGRRRTDAHEGGLDRHPSQRRVLSG